MAVTEAVTRSVRPTCVVRPSVHRGHGIGIPPGPVRLPAATAIAKSFKSNIEMRNGSDVRASGEDNSSVAPKREKEREGGSKEGRPTERKMK